MYPALTGEAICHLMSENDERYHPSSHEVETPPSQVGHAAYNCFFSLLAFKYYIYIQDCNHIYTGA